LAIFLLVVPIEMLADRRVDRIAISKKHGKPSAI